MSCIMYTAQLGKWIHEYFEDSINLDKLDNSTRAVDLEGKNHPHIYMDVALCCYNWMHGYLRVG